MNLKAIKERCEAVKSQIGTVSDRDLMARRVCRDDVPALLAWVENARLVLEAVEIPVPTPDTPGFSDAFNLSEIQRALLAELDDAEMEE